jgi:inosine-uridine nucleoside N-ribohydrolase
MKMKKPQIIIDTDAGHDDALAMMLLIKSELTDIRAVTSVCGNSTINNVTRNAQAVLDLLHADIPLYSGCAKPLKRELVQAVVHGKSGLDGLDMNATNYKMTNDAPERIAELVRTNPHEITIVALGPLTNIARCFQETPDIIPLIKEIVIMGGAINVPGNKNRVAEFNMFVDPEAADIVFRSDVRKILVPLDPCNDIILALDTFEALEGTQLHQPLVSLMKHFIAGIAGSEGVQGALVYDALAAYYLVNPAAYTTEDMDVVIETKGEHTFGMTVTERRLGRTKQTNATVVTHIDQRAFIRDLLANLRK